LFYFEVYAPSLVKQPAMRIRILNRATGEEKNNSGQMVAYAFDEGGRHIGADFGNSLRISLMGLEVEGEAATVAASLPGATNRTLRSLRSTKRDT